MCYGDRISTVLYNHSNNPPSEREHEMATPSGYPVTEEQWKKFDTDGYVVLDRFQASIRSLAVVADVESCV